MHWIPFWQWNSWTPAERGEITAYYENIGIKWAIDLKADRKPELQFDYDNEAFEQGVTVAELLNAAKKP